VLFRSHYFILCFTAILGTIQGVAARYDHHDLLWIEGRGGYVFSGLTIAASFTWFFLADDEIFIPGLAGGELFAIFLAAFVIAVPTSRTIAFILAHVRSLALVQKRVTREKEPLA
jgi:hypothetical protein